MIVDADIELFLPKLIRQRLGEVADPDFDTAEGHVSNRQWSPPPGVPNTPPPKWQVIVRDDGVSDGEAHTGTVGVGVTILAGTKDNPVRAIRLSKLVKAIVRGSPGLESGNPITAVRSMFGPTTVADDTSYTRRYFNATLAVVGEAI